MRVVNISAVVDEICRSEAAIGGPVERLDFLGHSNPDVYRVVAGGHSFIACVAPDGTESLKRLRDNLDTLRVLDDERIPRQLAWRKANQEWAVLMYREIPGEELSRSNATEHVLTSLGELLFRLHSIEEPAVPRGDLAGPVNEPSAFVAFGESLIRRLADLPIGADRIRRHLESMSVYLADHAREFLVPARLIHGDLHRSNIVSTGSSVGLIDWDSLTAGDYAFDLATLKFVLDAVAPRRSVPFIRARARSYRDRFDDASLELRLRFFLALAGLVRAFNNADDRAAFGLGRAWRVRACYLHSEGAWRRPLRLDAEDGRTPSRTDEWALDLRQPFRGLFYLVAPRRVS